MQQLKILYLDTNRDKALHKALNRHGAVFFAQDLNAALFQMADHDFDYYFVDADIPQAQAFLQHLRHDPQLVAPRGVVLLTGNDDEDCEAWGVDTFLTRETALDDLPYIFSHLKGDRCESATVLRIASFDPDEIEQGKESRQALLSSGEPGAQQSVQDEPDVREHLSARRQARTAGTSTSTAPPGKTADKRLRHVRVALVVTLVIAIGAWFFVAGPLSSKATKQKSKASGRKSVDAKSTEKESGADKSYSSSVTGTAPTSTPLAVRQAANPATPVETSSVTPTGLSEQPSAPPAPEPAPAPASVNHAPSVHISGPTQLTRGQTANYSASGSDPDGDAVSLSWTSKAMCWSTPGLYSLSVTATDSRGSSGSDSISIRVI
jgi:hypothetical protein